MITLSAWTALMVKQDFLVEGKIFKGAPVMPLGVTRPRPLVKDEAKLLFNWLAIVDAAVAILEKYCLAVLLFVRSEYNKRCRQILLMTGKENLLGLQILVVLRVDQTLTWELLIG